MIYNKLVRDKIPELILQKGGQPLTHIASEDEYWQKLKDKLLEECNEFVKDETIEELADIIEVVETIISYKKFDNQTVKIIKEKKATEKGKFDRRIILE